VLAIGVSALGSPVALPACPRIISASDPALQQVYVEFKRSVEASPLVRHLGRPVSCLAHAAGGAVQLTYESPRGSRLEARRDPAIELTEQRLSESGMSSQAAVALLQRTERWAFGDKGCSIAWTGAPVTEEGPAPGRRDVVYRGADCNCQARLVHDGVLLTGLVFRSAC